MDTNPDMLICDWGSTHLRAYRVDPDGTILSHYESKSGVKALAGMGEGAYREALHTAIQNTGAMPACAVRISGMAGSKKGWVETAYLAAPAGRNDIASNFVSIPGLKDTRLYGGLKYTNSDGSIDVMRGEEIQILGVVAKYPDARVICLPGTHSKWVDVRDGRITGFRTHMTGDLFCSLRKDSIFAEQISSTEFHPEGFLEGCRLAQLGIGLEDLFRLRTAYVFGEISEDAFHSYLSGFLIANEIRVQEPAGEVFICGSEALSSPYVQALRELSVSTTVVDSKSATIQGHLSIHQP